MTADDSLRFAPASTVIAFAFSLGAVLAAVLPTRQEYADFADDRPPDAYSLAYLHVLTRANPDDEHLRVTYVRHLQKLGRFSEALSVLAQSSTPATLEVENLRLDLMLARARAIPEGQAARRAAFASVLVEIHSVGAMPQPPERLERLAELTLELGEPGFAGRLYLRAAETSKVGRTALLAEAGRWLRASGDRPRAAAAYELASRVETDPAAARSDGLEAVETLESDDRACDAADLAGRYVVAYPHDAQVLSRAAVLSEECDRPYAARDYGRRLLALSPGNLDLVEQQSRRELAAGDAQAAFPLIEQLVGAHPDDVSLRELDAHVAEWSSHPERALDDWLWLLERGRPHTDGE